MRVALVTSERLPEAHWSDADSPLLADELIRLGSVVGTVAWDGPEEIDWAGYDVLVLQSPWSMWHRLGEFREWLDARAAEGGRLLNPPDIVRTGSDKRYLARLAAAGVATVPTVVIDSVADLGDIRAMDPGPAASRRSVVVKPIASGGALGIREFGADRLDDAAAYARTLLDSGTAALAQPYLEAVDVHRELGVLTLGEGLSHAVTKAAILRPDTDQRAFHPDPRPHVLTPEQAAVAQRAHQAFLGLRPPGGPPPFSVRLDFLIDPATEPGLLLLEVEAVAPVRFLPLHPDRVTAFASAILAYPQAALTVSPS